MKRLKLFSLFLLLLIGVGQMWAESKTVTYTVTSASAVSTSGTAPDGSSVTFSNTYTTKDQITAGNSMTLTLSNFKVKVTNFTFSMHSNSSKGKGNLSYKVDNGSETFLVGTSSTSQTTFNSWGDNTSYGTSYRDVKWDVVDFTPTSGFVVYVRCEGQNSIYCQSFTITYEEPGGTNNPTLSSVTVSGTPTKTAYENGNAFDATGLTVTGTYSDSSNKTETTGITWTACKTQNGTFVALNNAAVALATNETDIYVKATVGGITSPAFHVTDLTVTAASPKITITQNEVADFAATYAQYTWTAGGVSGKMYAYKNAGMQFNPSKTGYYVYNTDPIPGRITKITMTKASGTDRSWTPYVSTTAMTSASGTALDAQTVTTSGASWDVTGSNSYFYLTVSSGATVIGSIVITYEEIKNAVTVTDPATGTGTLEVTGAADLSAVKMGTELTVTATPTAATHHGGTVKVIKTGVTPEVDVTSTVYNAGTGKLTMPDYPITVSATFVADAAISVAVAAGQSSWGSVKLYNSTPAEVSSGTTFKPNAEFMIEAIPASSDYEFVSWANSAGGITLSAADAIDANLTLTAGEVSTTFTATFREAAKPYLTVDPESLTFGPIAVNGSQNKTFGLTGENLTANASLAISGTGAAMFSVAASVAKDKDGLIAEDVTVTYNPTAAGTHTATLTISSDDAEDVEVALSGEAKVLRTVKWYSSNSTEITGDDLGEATTSVLDGGKVTTLPDAPTSCDQAISFQGWTNATYAKSDDAPTVLFTDAEDAPEISGDDASYYAVWANASGSGGSVEITRNTTDFPSSYAAAADYTLNGYSFNILQVYNNSNATGNGAQTMQWRGGGNSNGTGTIYNKDVFPGHISSIVIVYASDDSNKNIGLNIGDSENPTSGTSITPTNSGSTYTFDCSAYNFDYFVLTNGSGAGYTTSITINYAASIKDYSTVCSAPVVIADPTFSPAATSSDNDIEVSISAAQGMTIYYSIGAESNPKTSGTAYSSAISVTEDKVIKAVATDGNGNWSNVVTKTYTINYSPSIATYIAKAQATTRYLRLNAAQNCVVTAVKKNNQDKVTNIYCQDNSGAGIIIYNGGGFGTNVVNVGDRIVGTVSGTWSPYLMQPEMGSAVFADGATFTAVSRPDAPTVTVANVNSGDAYTAHPMMLVTVENLFYKSVSGSTYTFNTQANGEGTDITIYDNFSYLSGKTMPGVACTIVGIMARNNNNYQILPVELTTAAQAALPTIDPEGSVDAENAEEVTYLSTVSVPLVDNEDIYVSVNDAAATKLTEDASITIENDTKIAVTAKRDFYADNSVTYFYKPSSYPQSIGVTSEHGTVVVKVNQTIVSTALPGTTVTFTITPENEHFHVASTSVTYEGGSLTPSLSENVYSFTMPDKDATIVVNYTEDTKYSITFNGGGAEGAGPAAIEDQYAGAEITLPTKDEANYTAPTDKVFNGWLVTSGEDVVEQDAGKFNMPAGNVTITAQWADRVYCALTLNINGATSTENIDREEEYTLPTNVAGISGYDFYGWAEEPETDDVEEAIDILESFTPGAEEASKTLYAVFKRTDNSAAHVGDYEKVTANLGTKWAGDYLIAYSDAIFADGRTCGENGIGKANQKAVPGDKLSGNYVNGTWGDTYNITLEEISTGSNTYVLKTKDNTYNYRTANSNGITTTATKNTAAAYPISVTFTSASDIKLALGGSASGAVFRYNSSASMFRYYANGGQSAIYLYKKKGAPTYYTTAPAAVNDVTYALGTNPNGTWKENEGCNNAKVKVGQTYNICTDEPVRDHHKFNGWSVMAGETQVTVTDGHFTMPEANVTITAVWVAKVENNLTYSAGTDAEGDPIVAEVEEGTEVTLKAIGSGEGQANFTKTGYNFKGWLSNGVLYKAGETFEMPANAVEFVAQWKKQSVDKYTLVTNASQLLEGSKVVIAYNDNANTDPQQYLAGQLSTTNTKYLIAENTNVEFSENTVTFSNSNVIEWTLVKTENGWKLKSGDNYLGESGDNVSVNATNQTEWSIAIADNGNATLGSSNNYTLRFNSSSPRFKTYNSIGMKLVQLYASMTAVNSDMSISEIGYVDNEVIVIGNDVKLTVDADIAPVTMIVPKGSTVTVNDNQKIDANTLIVERGGTLDIQTNGTVKTDETFVIYSTLGKGNGGTSSGNAPGSSSQIKNANKINATGDVFFELELTQETKASEGWYAFSVPFPVDAMTGVYYGNTQLQNEVGYAIMSYHGDKRAAGEYAWKKYRDIMVPGVLYIIAVGDTDYKTLRFKKHGNEAFSASTNVAVKQYSSVDNTYAGWNGIGNPSMQVSYLPETENVYYMQFLDHANNRFQIHQRSKINLVVGSAFFIQYRGAADGQIAINTGLQDGANGYLAPTRERSAVEESIYEISLFNTATNEVEDNVFITAREEATNSYEIGRDVAKMIMGTAKCAQMSIQAYGKQLGAADFPLVNGQAAYPLTITAPAAGTYTISTEAQDNADIYLTQDGAIIWNLSMGEYELNLTQGTMNDYGLLLVEKAPGIATGVDEISGEKAGVQKIVIEDKVFILRGGKMYDVTGKAVK